jgi:nicotinate phosphoribosyltransferase
MLTDMYQVTMAYSYWKNNHHNDHSVFDVFFRKCPFKGEYTVFGGVSEIIDFLSNFSFNDQEILYLKSILPNAEEAFFQYMQSLNGSMLKVWMVPDGTVVFPRINLVRIEGPLALAQLCETTVLVLSNFATLITTNAARFRKASGEGKILSEFGCRRAQGPDGSMTASKYSYVGGFDSTSNLLAGMIHKIPTIGTHAHSYVNSYTGPSDLTSPMLGEHNLLELAFKYKKINDFTTNEGELVAFVSYAIAFPYKFLALVDTYDTLNSGVPNFLCVALALNEIGYKAVGIRLDSGDLAYLSKEARKVFVEISQKFSVDFSKLLIVASNDINEIVLKSLREQGHEIDVFGIGTNLVTCQAQPALGMVFKLVEVRDTPRIKFSNEKEKTTIPCKKNAFRLYGSDGIAICDIMGRANDPPPQVGARVLARNPLDDKKKMFVVPSRVECLNELLWDGKLIKPLPSLEESRNRLQMQLRTIRNDITREINPTPYKVSLTSELYEYMMHLWELEVPIREFR